ncbi:MAG: hypothetical protein KGI52_07430 [Burkholderiales bacterium]|nr:hypothetical protein [Burkholderiales bacterium]
MNSPSVVAETRQPAPINGHPQHTHTHGVLETYSAYSAAVAAHARAHSRDLPERQFVYCRRTPAGLLFRIVPRPVWDNTLPESGDNLLAAVHARTTLAELEAELDTAVEAFEDIERQRHIAQLGTWGDLASPPFLAALLVLLALAVLMFLAGGQA